MSEIKGNYNYYEYNPNKQNVDFNSTNIELEDISILYSTEKAEENRSTFEDTFKEKNTHEITDGEKFLNGLIENKSILMEKLGLSDEEYDNLACIALGLASQETGMGEEAEYKDENTGFGKIKRKFEKWVHVNIFNGDSASSGLTQMKIYDFLNGTEKNADGKEVSKLTEAEKEILYEFGIEAKGIATNNLYDNPDKSAVATMVVLSSLYGKYDDYKNKLSTEHEKLETTLGLNTDEEKQQAEQKGEKILQDITTIYNGITNTNDKAEMRQGIKSWLLAVKNHKNDELNEEIQLANLNKIVQKHSSNFSIKQEDLNYIRYELTTSTAAMNQQEYCAYAWNKGTGETGMQLDRILADTIGTILKNPEDFDYDQFVVNVATLSDKYREQTRI